MIMEIIEGFVKKLLESDNSFTLNHGNKNYYFMQNKVGKGKYVYGNYAYLNNEYNDRLDAQYKVVAIVSSDNIVYLYDKYFFGIFKDVLNNVQSKNIQNFYSYLNDINKYVNDIVYPKFYDTLETIEITEDYKLDRLTRKVRETLLSINRNETQQKLDDLFNEHDVAKILCGLLNVDDEAYKRLECNKDMFIQKKSLDKKFNEIMKNSNTVKKYELEIIESLRNVDAKTVNVEFELNGKKDSIKITPDRIMSRMIYNQDFDTYDFEVSRDDGKKFLKSIGVKGYMGNGDVLTCENISKITYSRKDLYVKKDVVKDNNNLHYDNIIDNETLNKDMNVSMQY